VGASLRKAVHGPPARKERLPVPALLELSSR